MNYLQCMFLKVIQALYIVLLRFISFRAKLRNFNWDKDILYSNHKDTAKEAESHFLNLLTESKDFSLKAPSEDFEMSQ